MKRETFPAKIETHIAQMEGDARPLIAYHDNGGAGSWRWYILIFGDSCPFTDGLCITNCFFNERTQEVKYIQTIKTELPFLEAALRKERKRKEEQQD